MLYFKKMGFSILLFGGILYFSPAAGKAVAAEPAQQEIQDVVKKHLQEKTKGSGTLDLFDEKIDAVRNLRMMESHDAVKKEEGLYVVPIDYRDIKTGAVVDVEVSAVNKDNAWTVKSIDIKNITEIHAGDTAPDANKEYSDNEIQDVMKKYLLQQAKFTGSIALFDGERKKMRNLELLQMSKEVRRLGAISISSADFKDKDSGEKVVVDVAVENQKGKLSVQSLRIREVKKS